MEAQTDLVERVEQLTPHERRNVVAALQELLATCNDAKVGYEEAARDVRDPELAQLLGGCAVEQEDAGKAVAELIVGMGAEPHLTHSLGAELHRRVIALRGSMSHGDPASILPECERGEHIAIGRYERALAMKMPLPIADTLLDLVTACRERHAAFDRMRHPW